MARKRSEYYRSLSGGLKQRLPVALALAGNPKVAVREGGQVIVTGTGELANTVILTLAFVAMTGRHLHEEQLGRAHR